MPRVQLLIKNTFDEKPKFFPSGSTLLDKVNGGGWGLGRVINIVGDSSTGKTLLAIEAAANFAALYGAANIRYNETEAAFDRDYAQSIGFPEGVEFVADESEHGHGSITVEDFNSDIETWLDNRPKSGFHPCLYILDSVDAMSDSAEMTREIGEASYGTGKAKAFSEFFRRRVRQMGQCNCTLLIISQIRDKIGVTFGEKKTRSGGHALDFYASQIVWLSELGKIKQVYTGVERVVGIDVRVRNKKNKLGPGHQQADVTLLYNYGIDDEQSMIDWLKKSKLGTSALTLADTPEAMQTLLKRTRIARDLDKVKEIRADLKQAVETRWDEVSEAMRPPLSKYDAT